MKKIIFLFMLSLFVYDVGADIFDTHTGEETHASACHGIVCQTHFYQPNNTTNQPTDLTPQGTFITFEIQFTEQLFEKNLFRPPRHLA